MKTHILCLAVLLAAVAFPASGQERSDYQIVRGFERAYKAILESIDAVATVQECADVSVMIDELEQEFGPDKELLDRSLYPDKYNERITRAMVQLRLAQNKLGVIESHVGRIAELETQVRELTAQVEALATENATLLGDVKRLGENIRGLSAGSVAGQAMTDSLRKTIGRLQKNIRDRDDMIFALVDSLFMQYDKNVGEMTDVERSRVTTKLERGNVFGNIRKSIQDNIAFLEVTRLTGSDLSEMMKEHARFASQWKGFGGKLGDLYAGGKKKQSEMAVVDTMLAGWSAKLNDAFWRELALSLKDNGLAIGPFTDGPSFVAAFAAAVDTEIRNEDKEGEDERFKRYEQFEQNLWEADMSKVWLPLMVEQGRLTEDDLDAIDAKVDDWKGTVSPPPTVLYVVIFLFIMAVLAVLYVRMKKQPAQ